MSDTSIDDFGKERIIESDKNSVCKDFLRGGCERKFCRFKHGQEVNMLNFCHDFQNSGCPRPSCKFIHCSSDESEEYKRSGEMSNQIMAEATRKNQMPGFLPICNSFRKGLCRRPYCRYRHLSKADEDAEIMELIKNNTNKQIAAAPQNAVIFLNNESPNSFFDNHLCNSLSNSLLGNRRTYQFEEIEEFNPTQPKRRFIASALDQESLQNELSRRTFKGYFAANPPPVMSRMDPRALMFEEENLLLQKEIAQLKKQVSDLTATNEFLLDQNATLRVSSKQRNGTVTVPAVTITNTLPCSSQAQVIRTVAASVATVPVSLATVTTCNPVSGMSATIAGCPAVSIASASQILAPSQQILVTTNQPSQLALANSSQAQLAMAQQNLANNLAQQPQLTSQAQQLALATTTQQLTSQAQQLANQQLAMANTPQQITTQTQQLAIANSNQQIALANATTQAQQLGQQLTSQAQQLNQQLTSQAQQLALANTTQQLTSQAQQLALANTALANTTQQLTSQAQQLALANTPLTVANCPQQLQLASTSQHLLAQQQSQMELHRTINTSQTIAMSNATSPMVSYPIMTHALGH